MLMSISISISTSTSSSTSNWTQWTIHLCSFIATRDQHGLSVTIGERIWHHPNRRISVDQESSVRTKFVWTMPFGKSHISNVTEKNVQRICENISFRSDVKNMKIVACRFVFLTHATFRLNWESLSETTAPSELKRRIFQIAIEFKIDAETNPDAFRVEYLWSKSNADDHSSQCYTCIESHRYLRRFGSFETSATLFHHFFLLGLGGRRGTLAGSSDTCGCSLLLRWYGQRHGKGHWIEEQINNQRTTKLVICIIQERCRCTPIIITSDFKHRTENRRIGT